MCGDEYLVPCVTEPLDVHWDLTCVDGIPNRLSHHRGCQGAPCHANELDERSPQSEALEYLVLEGEAAGQRQCRYVSTLSREACGIPVEQRVQLDHRNAPLVHHPPRAHARAPASPVHGQQIHLVLRRIRQCLGQRRWPIRARLEEDVPSTHAP